MPPSKCSPSSSSASHSGPAAKTLRSEFEAPNAPFVVATIGFGGWAMEGNALTVAHAQFAVSGGERGNYPGFAERLIAARPSS